MISNTHVQHIACCIRPWMMQVCAILVPVILIMGVGCEQSHQGKSPPLPSQITELTLHDVEGLEGLSITDETLDTVTDYDVPAKTTQLIFSQTTHKRDLVLWKGSCLGVAKTKDGACHRIAFSYYGGFFKILGHEGYYQTSGPSRQELDLLIRRVSGQVFIPAREARNRTP